MSREYYRRGRNWYTAMGVLFVVIAGISFARQLLSWDIEVVIDSIINQSITSEKIAIATAIVGVFIISMGFRKK